MHPAPATGTARATGKLAARRPDGDARPRGLAKTQEKDGTPSTRTKDGARSQEGRLGGVYECPFSVMSSMLFKEILIR